MEEGMRPSGDDSIFTSSHLGRVMNCLLSSRPKKLEYAISLIHSGQLRSSEVLLDEPIYFLRSYIQKVAEKGESLDEVLVPMIEHSIKFKGSKHQQLPVILLKWLLQDQILFPFVARNLADIILRKDDRYIILGWCTVVQDLVSNITNETTDADERERHFSLLMTFSSSISHLSSVIYSGSTFQDQFELPTRLSVAAADCILVLIESLINISGNFVDSHNKINRKKSIEPTAVRHFAILSDESKEFDSTYDQVTQILKVLWEHLDDVLFLVQKLQSWNQKSRPLHAKGLGLVVKWLQELQQHYNSFKEETNESLLKEGASLLASCWRYYGILIRLNDYKFHQRCQEMLNQFLSAIQIYSKDISEHSTDKRGKAETRKFFLICLCLLWGRLDRMQLTIASTNWGLEVANLMISQLQCDDEDIIDLATSILRAIIFRPSTSSNGSIFDLVEVVFPSLINLLDERDFTAKAVVLLTAEYYSLNPDAQCCQQVFHYLATGSLNQKKNALDVISEVVHISHNDSHLNWKDITKHLMYCLKDEELVIRDQASKILLKIDPCLTLPSLVVSMFCADERMQSLATDIVAMLLTSHNQNADVMILLLDSLSKLYEMSNLSEASEKVSEGMVSFTMEQPSGPKLDIDRVLKLVPRWGDDVINWSNMVIKFLDKMFAEPSNTVLVKFLSYMSEHMAEAKTVVLRCLLVHMKGQEEIDEKWLSELRSGTFADNDLLRWNGYLFDRLCPLLIIRVLPLRVFNDLSCSAMYGQLDSEKNFHESSRFGEDLSFFCGESICIASILVKRAFDALEFEDVRKLGAELCGRLHPRVILPVIEFQLASAASCQDILKIKACLFAICTSLVIRGRETAFHPSMKKIRSTIELILCWSSLDGNEVMKAQHGCIDSLALMICAELGTPDLDQYSGETNIDVSVEERNNSEDAAIVNSVLSYVIEKLVGKCIGDNKSKKNSNEIGHLGNDCHEKAVPVPFRLCMANVLISTCQKITSSGKKCFATKVIPVLIFSFEEMTDPLVRAACVQVLFSAVYHLKYKILPYAPAMFKLSIKALRRGSEKERVAGAKLMASLMASEDSIVESISSGLMEARSLLLRVLSTDCSPELSQVCQKLLMCTTPSGHP